MYVPKWDLHKYSTVRLLGGSKTNTCNCQSILTFLNLAELLGLRRHVTRRPVTHRRRLSDIRSGPLFFARFIEKRCESFLHHSRVQIWGSDFNLDCGFVFSMAMRNRTFLFRKYRDALKSVRVPVSSSLSSSAASTSSGGGPVIELVSTSLLNPNRSYAPLSTEDPGNSRSVSLSTVYR